MKILRNHLEEINLSHRDLLNEKLEKLDVKISEYTFANMYLFRKVHRYQLMLVSDYIFVAGFTRDKFSFLMPTVPLIDINPSLIQNLLSQVEYLFPIPDQWKNQLDPQLYQASFSENDSDYLFTAEKMRTYAGRHLDGKRNLVRQLLSNYQLQVSLLTSDRLDDALAVLENWQQSQEINFDQTDYHACQEALHLLESLHLTGMIFYVNQAPSGFVLGELMHHGSHFNLLFSKAQRTIKGLHQYMYQALAQSLSDSVPFINLQQDLGLPQLRKTKQSYQPDCMLHKWRIQLAK